jgi:hypothetical protein
MAGTSPEIVAALKRAVAAVEAAGVPEDLRVAAFQAALGDMPSGAAAPGATGAAARSSGGHSDASRGGLAGALKVSEEGVSQVFDIDDEGVHLVIQRSRLDGTKKTAQQEVAFLILAARRAVLAEEWTPIKVIADLAQEMGVHDSNFSKGISAINGDGVRIRGDKSKRELKINQVGIEKAAQIITRITE